ncbi:MAG: dihydromethanopterin reductase (acceptor) [Methanobacterium sp.]|uniref:dihydromethanopterin reductase (acceptor) n=1 Tax=Methanobacterium sp. TaxID=2164 RepID=UPI003D65D074|nr:dihydromethanopterin reductase (acceptor) [Methanobacterium sp.]
MKIAWGITGAGHLLLDSVELLEKISKNHNVTVLLSAAGEEVLKMYGLYERVEMITGGYYNELVKENDQKFSFPITGRFSLGKYDLLIVSPTTSNTIGKIANGIADSLLTNAVAQAGKGKVKTVIVPVDLESGDLETVLPSKLELDLCQRCEVCEAAAACPGNAITPGIEIDLLKCQGCGACAVACPFSAISAGRLITIYMREIDIANTAKLYEFEDLEVIEHPSMLKDHLNL